MLKHPRKNRFSNEIRRGRMKIKKSIVTWEIGMLVVFQLITVTIAQAQYVYHNEEGHFSFVVPDGWEEYSRDYLNSVGDAASRINGRPVRYIAGFGKGQYPYVCVQIDKKGRATANEVRKLTLSRGNMIFQQAKMPVEGRNINILTVIILSNYGFTCLSFGSPEERFDGDCSDFNQIIDSFRFDDGFGY